MFFYKSGRPHPILSWYILNEQEGKRKEEIVTLVFKLPWLECSPREILGMLLKKMSLAEVTSFLWLKTTPLGNLVQPPSPNNWPTGHLSEPPLEPSRSGVTSYLDGRFGPREATFWALAIPGPWSIFRGGIRGMKQSTEKYQCPSSGRVI